MTVHLVTFSDESMSRSRELCIESAMRHGVELCHEYRYENHAQSYFWKDNRKLLTQPRGLGYWTWKPHFILTTMIAKGGNDCADGDILIYADAGVEFINNVNYIIDRMDQDVFLFGNNWEHAHWCKRDVIDAVWPQSQNCSPWECLKEYPHDVVHRPRFGKQAQASVIFFRVSDYTQKFVREWLDWCLFEGGRLIDDSPSRTPNHPEFREHRHDQAILTTLAYREGIKLHYWPASYNDGAFTYEKLPEYAGDDYPILFNHHRRRNHEWSNAA